MVVAQALEPTEIAGYELTIRATPPPSGPAPDVFLTELTVRGAVDEGVLRELIESQLEGVAECFRAGGLSSLEARVIISPTGSVQNAGAEDESAGAACVVAALRQLSTEPVDGGGIGLLQLTFATR